MTDANFWNRQAESYSKKAVANPQAFERKIAITRSRIRPGHVIADIGCGTGSLALRLCSDAAQVHGLDVSDEMIRIARAKAATQGATNVTFHVALLDDNFTGLAPASLDGVCAYSLLHLVEDRPALLRRVFQLLRPGGFFVSSTPCLGGSWLPFGPLLGLLRVLRKAPRVQLFSKTQLMEEVQQAGFVDLTEPDVGAKPNIAFVVAGKAS